MRFIKLLICIPLLYISFIATSQVQRVKVNVSVTNYSGKVLVGEQIWFKSVKTKKVYKGTSDENGHIAMELLGPDNYFIMVKSVGDAQDYSKLILPTLDKGRVYGTFDITVEIDPAKEFTLDHVYFETGKSILKSDSYQELDELQEYLSIKENTVIEIGGHTDNVGETDANLKLSKNRAASVKSYLIKKGIKADRVLAKGYGESDPIADNNTENGRKLNRRTEVRIISE